MTSDRLHRTARHDARTIVLGIVIAAVPVTTLLLLGEMFTNITHKFGPDALVNATNCGSLMDRGGCAPAAYGGRATGAWITAAVLAVLILTAVTLGVTALRARRADRVSGRVRR